MGDEEWVNDLNFGIGRRGCVAAEIDLQAAVQSWKSL